MHFVGCRYSGMRGQSTHPRARVSWFNGYLSGHDAQSSATLNSPSCDVLTVNDPIVIGITLGCQPNKFWLLILSLHLEIRSWTTAGRQHLS